VQAIRKPKRAARSQTTAGKSARKRRSAEQMLVELRRRLREISDLNAASDVLNWGQATYMPEGGVGARGRQRAMLNRLAHERAVEPALGGLIDELTRYGVAARVATCVRQEGALAAVTTRKSSMAAMLTPNVLHCFPMRECGLHR
jgi:Zn-dependent M32 family carboxypeptidase